MTAVSPASAATLERAGTERLLGAPTDLVQVDVDAREHVAVEPPLAGNEGVDVGAELLGRHYEARDLAAAEPVRLDQQAEDEVLGPM